MAFERKATFLVNYIIVESLPICEGTVRSFAKAHSARPHQFMKRWRGLSYARYAAAYWLVIAICGGIERHVSGTIGIYYHQELLTADR